jgi:hypothetical protein
VAEVLEVRNLMPQEGEDEAAHNLIYKLLIKFISLSNQKEPKNHAMNAYSNNEKKKFANAI